jgi:FADH2 O2-dependent halogenase
MSGTTESQADFDVGIIGGGPAGSSMAAYLAKAGVRCVVFERELFPRPHVGESLVPSSTRVFKDLDFLPQMEEAKFPHKYGAIWTAGAKGNAYHHDFADLPADLENKEKAAKKLDADSHAEIRFEEREQPGVELNYTYHVDRGIFDQLLLKHAHKLGADVYEGVRVQGVDFGTEHPVVKYTIGRKEIGTSCRMIVDASGRHTILGNQLGLKIKDPVFDQYALHTWFEGFDREAAAKKPGLGDYIYIHFLPITNSWLWQIPITDTVTSIGVVTQKKHFTASKGAREEFFWESVGSRPELHQSLKPAKRLRPFKEEGDYSYAMKQICGDKFVLVGDAGRFVDPIFSTGVSIALNSSRFASRDVIAALQGGDLSREKFATFESTIRRGTKNWYDFITVYYRLNVLFTYFVTQPEYRLDVLKLLQGDVYDEETPDVLNKMRALVTEVEQDPDHPWHQQLGELTHNAFSPQF